MPVSLSLSHYICLSNSFSFTVCLILSACISCSLPVSLYSFFITWHFPSLHLPVLYSFCLSRSLCLSHSLCMPQSFYLSHAFSLSISLPVYILPACLTLFLSILIQLSQSLCISTSHLHPVIDLDKPPSPYHSLCMSNYFLLLKCPYYGQWKVHILVLGVPNNRLTCIQYMRLYVPYLLNDTQTKIHFPKPKFAQCYQGNHNLYFSKSGT